MTLLVAKGSYDLLHNLERAEKGIETCVKTKESLRIVHVHRMGNVSGSEGDGNENKTQ